MKTILMLLYGDKYDFDDVNRIVAATTCDSTRYNYVLYTDDPQKHSEDGLYPEVQIVRVDPDWGTFNKVKMLERYDLGACLYLDLDVVIQHPNIDMMFRGVNTICKTYWKPDGFEAEHGGGDFNSSVMAWNGNAAYEIWEHFKKDPDYYITKYDGCDDKYLFHEHKDKFSHWGKGRIYSYMFGIDHEVDTSPRGRKYRKLPTICLLNGQNHFDFDLRTDYYSHFSNN